MEKGKCKKCGKEIGEGREYCVECEPKKKKKLLKNKKVLVIIIILLVIIGGAIAFMFYSNAKKIKAKDDYEKRAIKVNISMTSYFGSIEYILYELDLDYDLVTMGANCYTGVQKNEFQTEKYGKLYTEFRYCKSNYSEIFRVYNDEKDQPLRDPKANELKEFDKYGDKVENKNNSSL